MQATALIAQAFSVDNGLRALRDASIPCDEILADVTSADLNAAARSLNVIPQPGQSAEEICQHARLALAVPAQPSYLFQPLSPIRAPQQPNPQLQLFLPLESIPEGQALFSPSGGAQTPQLSLLAFPAPQIVREEFQPAFPAGLRVRIEQKALERDLEATPETKVPSDSYVLWNDGSITDLDGNEIVSGANISSPVVLPHTNEEGDTYAVLSQADALELSDEIHDLEESEKSWQLQVESDVDW